VLVPVRLLVLVDRVGSGLSPLASGADGHQAIVPAAWLALPPAPLQTHSRSASSFAGSTTRQRQRSTPSGAPTRETREATRTRQPNGHVGEPSWGSKNAVSNPLSLCCVIEPAEMPDTNAPWGQQQQQQQQYSEQQYSEQQYSEQAVEITQTVRPRPRPRPRPHLQVGRHAEEATSSSVANGSAWSNGPPQVKGAPVGGAAVPPLARPKLRPPFTEPSLPTFRPKLPTLSVLSPPSIDGTTPMRPPPTFAGNGHMFAPEDAAFRHYSAPGLAPGPLPGPVPGQRFIMPLPAQQFYPMYASTYRTAAVPLLPPFHQPSGYFRNSRQRQLLFDWIADAFFFFSPEPGQEVTLSPIKHRKLHILDPQGTEIALEPAKPPVAPQTNTLNVTAQLKDVSHRATPSAPTAAQFFRVLKSHPDNYDIEAIWKLFFEGKIPSICDTIYMPDSVLVTQSVFIPLTYFFFF